VGTSWNDPRRVFGCLYHCAKFSWNHCSSFDKKKVQIFCVFGLKAPIHAPFGDVFGMKMGKSETSCILIPLGMQLPGNNVIWTEPHKNQFCSLVSGREQIVMSKKTKNHARVIFHPYAGTPLLGRSLWILACRVILPTSLPMPNFVNRFRGRGFWHPQICIAP